MASWAFDKFTKLDEIPFDFSRRMMSVVVEGPDGRSPIADQRRARSGVRQMHALRERRRDFCRWNQFWSATFSNRSTSLSEDGLRVLAIATKKVETTASLFQSR